MTDLSKYTLAELEAEIERRKAEPDYAAWEPKWQVFREAKGWNEFLITEERKREYIRALIAAHNTPLAGEDDGWTEWITHYCGKLPSDMMRFSADEMRHAFEAGQNCPKQTEVKP